MHLLLHVIHVVGHVVHVALIHAFEMLLQLAVLVIQHRVPFIAQFLHTKLVTLVFVQVMVAVIQLDQLDIMVVASEQQKIHTHRW